MSQSCPEMSMLTAFAAGEIAVEKGLSLAHHVDHCTSCQAKLQTIADEIKPLALSPSAITADSDQLATRLSEAKQWKRPLHRQAVDRFFVGDLEPWLKLVTTVDGKSQVAEFVLHRCLGRGGMGVVFLAEDRKLGRSVALKLMSPGLLADPTSSTRFQREAHASASINHPNVVTIHGVGVWHDLPYLVMELIEGQSLSDLMAQGPIPIRRIFEIAREMTDGLAAAHAAGVTHRDVKPQNILIQTDTGRIKLTDFGLAQTASDPALTKTGLMVGTPEFMAPEQVDPALGVVDARSDLFSLGSVIYSMCTGQPPFTGPSAISTLQAVCHTPHQSLLQSLPDVPPWFATLIDRLLEKQPADRPGSADEVSHALAMHQPPPQSFPRININSRSETQRSDRSARQTRVRPRRQQRLMIG
ncbi:MAG: serine/threonine-protein kinase, partial [Planctomycetota bacterium]